MTKLEDLEKIFGKNSPILLEDVVDEECSYDTAKTLLSMYVKAGDLRRYSQGVYYFPKNTIIGETVPNFEDVVSKKYIEYNKKRMGYITGWTLLNRVGVSTQVPNVIEVCTNVEKTRKRYVELRNRKVILRMPTVEITEENVDYLQFLDIFKYASVDMVKNNIECILNWYVEKGLNLNTLKYWSTFYSNSVKKTIRESKIYDVLTLR